MESYLNIIILVLLVLVFVLVIGLGVLIFFLIKEKKNTTVEAPSKYHPDVISKLENAKRIQEYTESDTLFCSNHEDLAAQGICGICMKGHCEKCLVEWDGLYFCREHYKTFANNDWVSITNVRTTPDNPEKGTYIYSFKDDLWKSEETPSYIVTHYKINVEDDGIESFVMLYVRKNDEELLRKRLVKTEQ